MALIILINDLGPLSEVNHWWNFGVNNSSAGWDYSLISQIYLIILDRIGDVQVAAAAHVKKDTYHPIHQFKQFHWNWRVDIYDLLVYQFLSPSIIITGFLMESIAPIRAKI